MEAVTDPTVCAKGFSKLCLSSAFTKVKASLLGFMDIKRKTMKISDSIQIDNDNVARTKIL